MTILGSGRSERFQMNPGAEDNRTEVPNVNRDERQLILMVHEPVRYFTEQIMKGRATIDPRLVKVVKETEFAWTIERKTSSVKRHFLCGTDERQYFIAQLPVPVTTVRQAHEVLRPQAVTNSKGKIVRQGEWFFVTPSTDEQAKLDGFLDSGSRRSLMLPAVVHMKVPIGPASMGRVMKKQFGGNPHIADELVMLSHPVVAGAVASVTVFVRGSVRHVDHNTVRFPSWVKVFRNTERTDTGGVARMGGVSWID
jgi:hypothetical protein